MTIPVSPTLVFIPVPELIILYLISFPVAIFDIYMWYRSYRKQGIDYKLMWKYLRSNFPRMVKQFFTYAIFQKKIVKNRYAGIMHLFIFYGFVILFIATSLIALSHDILKPLIGIGILYGSFYLLFEAFTQIGGIILIVGLLMALLRRITNFIPLHTTSEDYLLLSGILVLALEGFFLGALKIDLFRQSFDVYRFVEWYLSYIFPYGSMSPAGITVYRELWMAHVLTAFLVALYLPYSKLFHSLLAPTHASKTKILGNSAVGTPFLLADVAATGNYEVHVGAKKVSELSLEYRTAAMACTDCGRCERACPAYASGTDLDPRLVVQNVKKLVNTDSELVPVVLTENASWSCTTCMACVEECPVLIRPYSFVVETRRNLVMENKVSKEASAYLMNLYNTGNPLGSSPMDRDDLLQYAPKYEEGMEVLYWVGCMGAYDPRDKQIALTVIDLLKKAGVKFGILGSEEKCTGETARRMGEEGLFQTLAAGNIETFNKYGVKKIVTSCPHCFNTFKNEYPELGLNAEVVHHSEFLSELIKDGKLKVKNSGNIVTYHDPCYLGRGNGVYDDPRFIISSTGDLVEMEKSREKSFCCGAGGGNYWYRVENEKSISHIRMDQAIETKASTVGVACPFCMAMLSDAARTMNLEDKIQVKDISEIIKENLIE
ncbi:hypohtetical protein [Thermoplasma volcanium GSS1]|uniref:Hypohtetical protein n=1 Tax=Thermoplasma volcanium (strain ATCC 51530 / DSM 4299 / JCM 9571 / NBRC 15438 / GSS1) TaxID=273116 RepID=Q978J4_THEVO|nr:heterodisulfide reductase-related iron-sulfur binding cluster [Thermoplasma volcanium]BAB60563.1 hypohtetical protein [Thermoplasma volcanium GSS1]